MRFKQLRESMTTTIKWTKTSVNEYTFYYEYGLDQDIVNVIFEQDTKLEESVLVSFSVNGSYYHWDKPKETKIPPTVLFATVIDIVRDHEKNTKQDVYRIHGVSKKLNRIYEKLVSRYLGSSWSVAERSDYVKGIVIYKKA